jgi:anti-anti-sigma regulatory factor
MSTGLIGKVHFLQVPGGLTDGNLAELRAELDHILGEVIDNGFDKFVLDLGEVQVVNTAITNLVFKALEDCQTLRIKVRIVAAPDFARMLFGQDRLPKLSIFKTRDTALADF